MVKRKRIFAIVDRNIETITSRSNKSDIIIENAKGIMCSYINDEQLGFF